MRSRPGYSRRPDVDRHTADGGHGRSGRGDDALVIQFSDSITVHYEGGAGTGDTLVGPTRDSTWDITRPSTGTLNSTIHFAGVENLTGAANNEDTFVFTPEGTLDGLVDGGLGGFDTLIMQGGAYETVMFTALGPDSGRFTLDHAVITYAGLEPTQAKGGTVESVIIDLSTLGPSNDRATLSQDGETVTFACNPPSGSPTFESFSFGVPSGSLTIKLGDGDDVLHIGTLDSFPAHLTIAGNAGRDTVYIDGDLHLPDRDLDVSAEKILVGFVLGEQNDVSDWEAWRQVCRLHSDGDIGLRYRYGRRYQRRQRRSAARPGDCHGNRLRHRRHGDLRVS